MYQTAQKIFVWGLKRRLVEGCLHRFGDYSAASFQRAHVNVFISVSNFYMKVRKSQFEHKLSVVVAVVTVPRVTYMRILASYFTSNSRIRTIMYCSVEVNETQTAVEKCNK